MTQAAPLRQRLLEHKYKFVTTPFTPTPTLQDNDLTPSHLRE